MFNIRFDVFEFQSDVFWEKLIKIWCFLRKLWCFLVPKPTLMNQKPLQGVTPPPPQWHRLNKGPQKCAHQKIKKVPQATVYSKKNGCSKRWCPKKKKGLHLQFGGWNPYLPCFGPEYLMFFVPKFDVTLGVFAGITALYIQSSDIKFVQAESNLRL